YRVPLARDNVIMKSVFHVRRGIGLFPKASGVGFVFGEKQFRIFFAVEEAIAKLGVNGEDGPVVAFSECRLGRSLSPGPSVAEPKGREHVEGCCFWAAVVGRD